MLLFHFDPTGERRIADLGNLYFGQALFLIGGAPSLVAEDRDLFLEANESPLTMTMNNSATMVASNLWCGGDHPSCYTDGTVQNRRATKFAPLHHAEALVQGKPYFSLPNLFFFVPEAGIPWSRAFDPQPNVPWFHNTMFASLCIAYALGFRRIYLVGCDFEVGAGPAYAWDTDLSAQEKDWNRRLYAYQAEELCGLKDVFAKAGMTLADTSAKSKLRGVYEWVDLQDAIGRERPMGDRVGSTRLLPHSSRFAGRTIDEIVRGRMTPAVRSGREMPAVTVV